MNAAALERSRLRTCIRGAVQGVGFRPFVFRLASELKLTGSVNNSSQGVFLDVEGPRSDLEIFLHRLQTEKPSQCSIQSLESSWLDVIGFQRFEIKESETTGEKTAIVMPDIATCPDCLREMFDPADRRHDYPFTNCTHCGPRFSIIESLPYDRANTSMKRFEMCPRCRAEYDDPTNRRFHAQPNACPDCGPHLELWNAAGEILSSRQTALVSAAEAIRSGRIVAIKGIGGFQLVVAAHLDRAVQRLRDLKDREEKPFALMFPSVQQVRIVCELSALEERLLCSAEAPIVLLRRLHSSSDLNQPLSIGPAVAPGNPNLGVMLSYSPLHHLLMANLRFPVVATSGNLSDEPICIDEHEALERLAGIADLFLVHNRPIVRHVDDSIVRVIAGREMMLRRARGYAPLPVRCARDQVSGSTEAKPPDTSHLKPDTILAVGAHLKNSVAVSVRQQVFVSQHIGDLETDQAFEAFRKVVGDLQTFYDLQPDVVVADEHPDYLSTQFAREMVNRAGQPADTRSVDDAVRPRLIRVQHHIAHVLSCMAENELSPPLLGVAWDGTGYGSDGTIWGGEFFRVTATGYERVATFRPFRLLGGDRAAKEPRRSALSLLCELYGNAAFEMKHLPPVKWLDKHERATMKAMFSRGLNSPYTSSVGRLFDAVAALAGLRQQTSFEGQAAMDLEFALDGDRVKQAYELAIIRRPAIRENCGPMKSARLETPIVVDWEPMVRELLADCEQGKSLAQISAKFHNALSEAIVNVARAANENRVALSGGCFQNRYLAERTISRLRDEGFRPYWHQRVPPNDGGIALGQILAARRSLASIGVAFG